MCNFKGANRVRFVGADAFLTLERRNGPNVECVISALDAAIATLYRLSVGFTGSGKMLVQCQRLGAPKKTEMFARIVMGASSWQSVRFIDGNPMNLRHSNLMLMDSKNPKARGPNRVVRVEGDVAWIALEKADGSPAGETIVDADMLETLQGWRWHKAKGYVHGYPVYRRSEGRTLLHHLVIGKPGPGLMIDHVNQRPLDNRRSNLRFVTDSQNKMNKSLQSNNTSGFKGVTRHEDAADGTPRWCVHVQANGVIHCKGGFRTPEAADAYARALRTKLHGAFARHE